MLQSLLGNWVLKLSYVVAFAGVFYYLPNVNDFIVEILIGSINSQVLPQLILFVYY